MPATAPRPSAPRSRSRAESSHRSRSRAESSHRQDDLAELLTLREATLGGGAVRQRHHLVHDGAQPAREEQAHDVVELLPVGHGRPDDRNLVPEDDADVRLPDGPGGGATRDQAPALGHRAEGLLPRLGPDVLDDEVDAAPARLLEHGLAPVLARIVDADVGAERAGALELVVAR